MAESFGAVPFSIGGTNATGYSLVAAFTLTYNANQYSISSSLYDFGIMVFMYWDEYYSVSPIYFTNVSMDYHIPVINPSNHVSKTVGFSVTSSSISYGRITSTDIVSFAIFKFT